MSVTPTAAPRIGVAGFFLEAGRRSPPSTGAMFERAWFDALLANLEARRR